MKRVGGEKSFLQDSLSFFGLGSPRLEMALLSEILSFFFFSFSLYMATQGLRGATYVGTTLRLTDSSLFWPYAPPLHKLVAC